MNMKEAIEFFEKKNISGDELFKMKIKNVKKLAKMLKRGEKAEHTIAYNRKRNKVLEARIKGLKDILKKLEEKYVKREAELLLIIKETRKYKKMWRALKGNFPYVRGALEAKEFIEEFEQKYFPKKMIK